MLIVSNAFDMSRATTTVRSGGADWLKPWAMSVFILWSAVVVLCLALNPCCMGMFCRYGMICCACTILSKTFAIGDKSAMGR